MFWCERIAFLQENLCYLKNTCVHLQTFVYHSTCVPPRNYAFVKMDLPHVTVKAWKLHSGKAGLVGGTLLIYLCVEGTLRYYWWVTISSLLKSLLHDRNLAGFAWLTQAEITNKGHISEGIYYQNGSVLTFLRKPHLSCCAHECYRGTCWDCSGEKLQQELFKINGCLNVWCAASTQKRPHQTSPSETRLADLSPHWELPRRESIQQPMWLTCVQLRSLLTVNVRAEHSLTVEGYSDREWDLLVQYWTFLKSHHIILIDFFLIWSIFFTGIVRFRTIRNNQWFNSII